MVQVEPSNNGGWSAGLERSRLTMYSLRTNIISSTLMQLSLAFVWVHGWPTLCPKRIKSDRSENAWIPVPEAVNLLAACLSSVDPVISSMHEPRRSLKWWIAVFFTISTYQHRHWLVIHALPRLIHGAHQKRDYLMKSRVFPTVNAAQGEQHGQRIVRRMYWCQSSDLFPQFFHYQNRTTVQYIVVAFSREEGTYS